MVTDTPVHCIVKVIVIGHLYSALLWDEPIARDPQIWPVITRESQFYLPPTHEPYLSLLANRRARPLAGTYCAYARTDGQAELTWVTRVEYKICCYHFKYMVLTYFHCGFGRRWLSDTVFHSDLLAVSCGPVYNRFWRSPMLNDSALAEVTILQDPYYRPAVERHSPPPRRSDSEYAKCL